MTMTKGVGLILSSAALVGCGGSGGSSGPSDAAGVDFAGAARLPLYEFTLSDTGTEADRLVATAEFEPAMPVDVTIDSRIEPTLGEYDFAGQTVTFTAGAVAAESDFGSMVIDILEPVVLEPGKGPADVTIEVTMSIEGLVHVHFRNGFVDVERSGGALATFTLEEFEGLLAKRLSVPVWQHQSALAWVVLDLLRNLVVGAANAVALIDTNLQESISVDNQCDMFPGAPPGGAPNQGMSRLTWLGSGTIGTGDDFTWDHTGCWLDQSNGRGTLLDGTIRLRGLVGRTAGGELVQIGFQTVNSLGGILFDDVTIASTQQTDPTTVTVLREQTFVLSHGVRLRFDAL